MATSYTSLLGLALPVTGELQGTWGDVVNNYITSYIDASVAGTQTISGSQTAVTLSVTNGTSLTTVGSGATGSAQFQIINCTGNPGGLLTITAPASSRQYIIINATSTNQSVKIVGSGPTTGVTLVAGEKAHVAWNGSDFVKIATQSGTGDFVTVDTTNLEVTNIKAKDGTAALSIADSTGVVSVSANPVLSGGTANGVLYLNASKVATSGSALTFNGSTLATSNANASFTSGLSTTAGVITSGAAGTQGVVQFGSSQTTFNIQGGPDYLGMVYNAATALSHQWAIGGTERMRLLSGGQLNLGGNFTSTNNTLQVTGNTAIGYTAAAPANGLIVAGNVGVGTNAPAAILATSKSSSTQATGLLLRNPDGTTGSSISIDFEASSGTSGSEAALAGRISGVRVGSGTTGALDFFTTNSGTLGSAKMRLDSSGNLGLGVTPSAWGSAYKAMQIGSLSGMSLMGYGGAAEFGNNFYFDTAYRYAASTSASRYTQSGGAHAWYTAPSGTAGNAISFTQAMTLDASGNLGVGTTSPSTFGKLAVYGSGTAPVIANFLGSNSPGSGATYADIAFGARTDGTVTARIRALANDNGNGTDGQLSFWTADDTAGSGALTERARITSDGYFGIGTNNPSYDLQVGTYGTDADSTLALASTTTGTGSIRFGDGTAGIDANAGLIRYDHSADAMLFWTVATERARITSGGSFIVGGTTAYGSAATFTGSQASVVINQTSSVTYASLRIYNDQGSASRALEIDYSGSSYSGALITNGPTGESAAITTTGAYPLALGTNNTARAVITSGGDLCVGTNATISSSRFAVDASGVNGMFCKVSNILNPGFVAWSTPTAGDNLFIAFQTEGTQTDRGSITYNRGGGVVAYNTTSDYRAKDLFGPVQNSGQVIDALKVYTGKMKGATIERPMLVAHEAQEYVPYAVTGEKDAVNEDGTPKYQQMDVASLVPLLLAELQSLRARVAQLEGK